MKHQQDDRNNELLEEATELLDESAAKVAFMLCEAGGRELPDRPAVASFLDAVASVTNARLLALEGAEHVDATRDGVELPREWSSVEWPSTYRDLDFVRQLFYRWAAGIESQKRAYLFRMVGAVAMARAGRVKREMREIKRMTRSMVVYWEGEADQLGLPK